MNRKKFTFATFALVSLMSLSACNNPVTANDDNLILTFKGQDGTRIEYSADDLFGQYRGNQAGVAKFVEAITEVIIRNEINQEDDASTALKEEILAKAQNRVDGVKEQAQANARSNRTTYRDEFDKLLESYNVEDETKLKDFFAYQLMKEEVEENFYLDNKDGFINGDDFGPGYLQNRLPYHVKHILVKVSAGSNDFYDARITASEAKKLHAVALRLATLFRGDNFGSIARSMSEDDGSAAKFGDLGIMSKSTGFVNPFKLGVYSYEAFFNENTIDQADKLALPDIAQEYFAEQTLPEIPFYAFDLLNTWADVTKDAAGKPVNGNDPLYFPRNIIFNRYFNRHQIAVITPEGLDSMNQFDTNKSYPADLLKDGFNPVEELGGKVVLTDEKGRVILAARAGTGSGEGGYQGIHFIVVERSALLDTLNGVTLEQYFTTEIPGTTNYPKGQDGQELNTFVNFLSTPTSDYKSRAESVSKDIRNFDKHLNFRMIDKLIEDQTLTFSDADLETTIRNYMEVTRRISTFDETLQTENTWRSYIEFLDLQNWERERLIDDECAFAYLNNDGNVYSEGGSCYVKK